MKILDIVWKVSIPVAMLVMTVSTIYYQHKTAEEQCLTQAMNRNNYANYLKSLEENEKKSKGL